MVPYGGETSANNHFIHYYGGNSNNNNKEALTKFTSLDHGKDELQVCEGLLCCAECNGFELNSRHEFVVRGEASFGPPKESFSETRRRDSKSKSKSASQSLKGKFETAIQSSSSQTKDITI